jgi:hypothetical protein
MVKTTRRERFIVQLRYPKGWSNGSFHQLTPIRQGQADRFTASCGTEPASQPPLKPNACANDPNPPRVTPPDAASAEPPDRKPLDEESPLKKLLRDDHPPDQPWPPPEKYPRWHSALGCPSGAVPGGQFDFGISA